MSALASGRSDPQDRLRRLLVIAVVRPRPRRAEAVFQELDADPLHPADLAQGRRRPRPPLDHLGEQRQPHRHDPAVRRQPGDRLIEERLLVARELGRPRRQRFVRPPERRQHPPRVPRLEQVHRRDVPVGDQLDVQLLHEPRRGHPEVVADQAERLDVLAVALPERRDQPVVAPVAAAGEEPLLELVEHQQHLAAGRQPLAVPQKDQARGEVGVNRQRRERPRSPRRSRTSVSSPVALDVDRRDPGRPAAASSPALTIDDLPHPDGP